MINDENFDNSCEEQSESFIKESEVENSQEKLSPEIMS
jgi:hypothetical protein